MVFVGVITALVLLAGGISTPVGEMTNTQYKVNDRFNLSGINYTLSGKHVTDMNLTNSSDGSQAVSAANYTIRNDVILADGTLGATIGRSAGATFNGNVNASYTTQPLGYLADSGSRTIAGLIILFAALAIFVFTATPIGEQIKDWAGM
jgi:hypothetical protein